MVCMLSGNERLIHCPNPGYQTYINSHHDRNSTQLINTIATVEARMVNRAKFVVTARVVAGDLTDLHPLAAGS